MKNTVEYYMTLPYVTEVEPIPANLGGGYAVSIPLLGKYAFCADGDSIQEAFQNLEEVKRERFSYYLEKGILILEPQEEERYSGQFVLRLPKYLHKDLAIAAKSNGSSLNQYVLSLVSSRNAVYNLEQSVDIIRQECKCMKDSICNLSAQIETKFILPSLHGYIIGADDFQYDTAA